MRSDIAPLECLEFEPTQVKTLEWLPLAVRHKLDLAGLKLTLQQWQALDRATRLRLLRAGPADGFAVYALQAGAFPVPPREIPVLDEEKAAMLLCTTKEEARRWLAQSSSFARYVLQKQDTAMYAGAQHQSKPAAALHG